MQKWFTRLLIILSLVSTATVFVLFLILFFLAQGTPIYDFLIVFLRGLAWSIPLLTLAVFVTGIATYIEANRKKKQKAGFIHSADFDDAQVLNMLTKLSSQDRANLEQRLAENDAEEIISLADLLSQFEDKTNSDD